MIRWKKGSVVRIIRERDGIQEAEVLTDDGHRQSAIHYTDTLPKLKEGDRVKLNTTAVELGLGSGGYHFVIDVTGGADDPVEAADDRSVPDPAYGRLGKGHLMKLRYTGLQRAVLSVEEPESPHHALFEEPRSLDGMPVLIGELHSMLPIALSWIRSEDGPDCRALRVSYVMSDGGALPLGYSRHVSRLNGLGWLAGTVTYGHAYGGDLEAVNKYTALLAARHVQQADIAIAVMGPGIAGTGTPYGHTATEMAELIHAVCALGGEPVVIPRISFADSRARHRGISHHLLETLGKLTLARATVPLPELDEAEKSELLGLQLERSGCASRHEIVRVSGIRLEEIGNRLSLYPEEIRTMGRRLRDDPPFFAAVCAAARVAARLVRPRRSTAAEE
ncbi:DUF3866 family protein [Paenibacillus sp. GCM10012303]|jgi:hypothetical protein|uniref:DUF3866 family protein n=1 Tax=Paenibacillus sp. GCM10012303 TaxID=3317340 RepID=UPI00360D019B